MQKATLAGGCFWGVEALFKNAKGVLSTTVGYMGGIVENPTYEMVCTGKTGHAEAIEMIFNPEVISYVEILDYFFRLHDPTTVNRQHHDVGTQYRSAIFYHTDEQRQVALEMIDRLDQSGIFENKIVTQVLKAQEFYRAEEYHQDYLDKNPGGYMCHFLRN